MCSISVLAQTQELPDDFYELLSLLKLRSVTGITKSHPFDFLNPIKIRLHDLVLCLVISAIDQQSWDHNLVQLLDNSPILERAGDEEL